MLADDHTLVRAGIRALLEKLPSVKVVGEASDGREVLNLVKAQPPGCGFDGHRHARVSTAWKRQRAWPGTSRTCGSSFFPCTTTKNMWRALKAGAAGYLLKKAATAELETALHVVLRGEIYLSRESPAATKFPLHGNRRRKSPLEQLTGRQREILQLIAEGQNTKQIGDILKVSPKTVEYHRMKLMVIA
jgi:DNA-binding NarL/FixJ family response regulator